MREQYKQELLKYLEFGLVPSLPLSALLQGFIRQAIHGMSSDEILELGECLTFIAENLPEDSWGSYERVLYWRCKTQAARMLYYETRFEQVLEAPNESEN